MEPQEIDLRELFAILWRRLWLILLLPLVAAVTAGVYSYNFLTPIYQTSTTLWIKGEEGRLDYSAVIAARDLAKTYAEVAQSMAVANLAAKYMETPGLTGENIYGMVSATPIRDTEILQLSVTDTDPAMAAKKANAFAKAFREEIERSQMVQHIYVVDEARVPGGPIKPRPQMNIAIAFVLGGMAAVGLVFLLEYLDTSIRTPDDVVRRLGGPVLATVPHIELPNNAKERSKRRELAPIIVTQSDPTSSASEAFRVLRTNLQFLGLDKPLKSLLVTSAVPSEGKSITSANLAVALAQAGERVCLVDADLRLPTQSKLFGAQEGRGLTNVLVNSLSLDDALQHPLENLALLPSGPTPPNPSELLGSRRMSALIQELEQRFDFVVFDSVPTLGLADAVTLAPQVGGVLLVVRCNSVGYPEAIKARSSILAVKANLLGTVLDGIKVKEKSYYYSRYYSDRSRRSGRKVGGTPV